MGFSNPIQAPISKRYCFWFLLIITAQLIFWTLLPSLLLKNTYVDILENLTWGQHLQWGYDKDPYLAGWLTYFVYKLSGSHIWAIYFLSQLSIVACFWAVWSLAKRMLTPAHALIAVTLLITIQFYSHSTPEFNDDVLQLPLWSLTCLFFYDALKKQTLLAWCLTGLFAGLALMTKYYTLMLLLSMFLLTISNTQTRQSFLKPGIYLALCLFFLIIAPNIIWLFQHSFISINYAFNRAYIPRGESFNWINHLNNPFSFSLSMLGVIAPAIIISWCCFNKKTHSVNNFFDRQFILFLCFGPLFLTLLFSLITGGNIHYMWGTPLFSLFGIFFMAQRQPIVTQTNGRIYAFIISIIFLIWMVIYAWNVLITPYTSRSGGHETLPGKKIAEQLTQEWHARYHTPLAYVAGDRELSLNISHYSPDHPQPFFDWNNKFNPWINDKDVQSKGAIYIWPVDSTLANKIVKTQFKRTQFQSLREYNWAVHRWVAKWFHFNKIPPDKVLVGFMPPT